MTDVSRHKRMDTLRGYVGDAELFVITQGLDCSSARWKRFFRTQKDGPGPPAVSAACAISREQKHESSAPELLILSSWDWRYRWLICAGNRLCHPHLARYPASPAPIPLSPPRHPQIGATLFLLKGIRANGPHCCRRGRTRRRFGFRWPSVASFAEQLSGNEPDS
jgi:hypothetical protein